MTYLEYLLYLPRTDTSENSDTTQYASYSSFQEEECCSEQHLCQSEGTEYVAYRPRTTSSGYTFYM